MRRFASALIVSGVAALFASACGQDEEPIAPADLPPVEAGTPPDALAPSDAEAPPAAAPFRVSGVEIGSAVGPDNRVTTPAAAFAPTDTVFASVATEGAAPIVTLAARWTAEDGTVVHEESQTLSPTNPTVSEFHLAKPEGLAAGKYHVEISADGAAVGGGDFSVK